MVYGYISAAELIAGATVAVAGGAAAVVFTTGVAVGARAGAPMVPQPVSTIRAMIQAIIFILG
jgi:altronate dehydratase